MTRRDELMAEFKLNRHRMRGMGVYQVKNVVSGRMLLGSSSNLDGALQRERTWLALGRHMNQALQRDWNACGPESFVIEVLEELTPTSDPRNYSEELALLLEAWTATLEPWDERGYMTRPRAMR
jgi:hypothetical protein